MIYPRAWAKGATLQDLYSAWAKGATLKDLSQGLGQEGHKKRVLGAWRHVDGTSRTLFPIRFPQILCLGIACFKIMHFGGGVVFLGGDHPPKVHSLG